MTQMTMNKMTRITPINLLMEHTIFFDDDEKEKVLKTRVTLNNIFWISFLGTCALRKNYKDNQKVLRYLMNPGKLKLETIDETSNDILYSIKMLVDRGSMTEVNAKKLTKILAKLKTGVDINEGVLFKSIKDFMIGKIITPILPSAPIVAYIRDFKSNKVTLNDMIVPFYELAKKRNIALDYQKLAKPIVIAQRSNSNSTVINAASAASATAANMASNSTSITDKKALQAAAVKKLNKFEIKYEKCENAIANGQSPQMNEAFFHLLETVHKGKNLDHFSDAELKIYSTSIIFNTSLLQTSVFDVFNGVYKGALEKDSTDNVFYKIMKEYHNKLNLSDGYLIYYAISKYMNKDSNRTNKYVNSRVNYRLFEKHMSFESASNFDYVSVTNFLQSNFVDAISTDQINNFFKEWSKNGLVFKALSKYASTVNETLLSTIDTHLSKVDKVVLDNYTIYTLFKEYVLARYSTITDKQRKILFDLEIISKSDITLDIKNEILKIYKDRGDTDKLIRKLIDFSVETITAGEARQTMLPVLMDMQRIDHDAFEYFMFNEILVNLYTFSALTQAKNNILFARYDFSILPKSNDIKKVFATEIIPNIGDSVFTKHDKVEADFIKACISDYVNNKYPIIALSIRNHSNMDNNFKQFFNSILFDFFDVLLQNTDWIAPHRDLLIRDIILSNDDAARRSIAFKKYFDAWLQKNEKKSYYDITRSLMIYLNQYRKNKEIAQYLLEYFNKNLGNDPKNINSAIKAFIDFNGGPVHEYDKEIVTFLDEHIFSKIIDVKSTAFSVFTKSQWYMPKNKSLIPKTHDVINKYVAPFADYSLSFVEARDKIKERIDSFNPFYSYDIDDMLTHFKQIEIIKQRITYEITQSFENSNNYKDNIEPLMTEKNIFFAYNVNNGMLGKYIEYAPNSIEKVKILLKIIGERNKITNSNAINHDIKLFKSHNEAFLEVIDKNNVNDIIGDLDPDLAKPVFSNLINDNVINAKIIGNILDETRNKGIVPAIKRSHKNIHEILKFNNFTIPTIRKTVRKKETFKDAWNRIEKQADDVFKSIPAVSVQEVVRTQEELNDMSYNYHKKYHAGKHGDIAVKILKEYAVTLPSEQWSEFRKNNLGDGTVYPAFHATGSIAASMILRFGFKIIDVSTLRNAGVGVAGRMLDDGIYFGITLDKVAGYVGDGSWQQTYGTKGYIFEMDATLGKKSVNYNAAGLGNDSIKSPEYCVFSPNEQLKILKCYHVELISTRRINQLKTLNENTNEGDMMNTSFDSLMHEAVRKTSNKPPKQRDSIRYVFYDGDVCMPNGNIKHVGRIKIKDKRNVTISPNPRGTEIEIYNNLGINKIVRIPNVFTFVKDDPRGEYTQYIELIKGKIA